jgi:hypothetical protein
MDNNETLLRAIFMTLGRSAFPLQKVLQIVAPREDSDKNLVAYNLCDGNTAQADIAKGAKLDKSHLSRALARWTEAGIVVRIGKDQLPLHVYPLSKDDLKRRGNSND